MDLNCPYCDAGLEVWHDDGFGYQEDVVHQMTCDVCDSNFVFTTSVSYHYDASKADCLNGEDHEYNLRRSFPVEFSKMCCIHCDEERELTDQERVDFNIGTKKDYFKKLEK